MKEVIKKVILMGIWFLLALVFVACPVFGGNYVRLEKGETIILKVERL